MCPREAWRLSTRTRVFILCRGQCHSNGFTTVNKVNRFSPLDCSSVNLKMWQGETHYQLPCSAGRLQCTMLHTDSEDVVTSRDVVTRCRRQHTLTTSSIARAERRSSEFSPYQLYSTLQQSRLMTNALLYRRLSDCTKDVTEWCHRRCHRRQDTSQQIRKEIRRSFRRKIRRKILIQRIRRIAPKATPRLLALETFGWRPVSHGMHAAATGKEETQIPSASMCGMKIKSKFMLYRFSLQFFWYFILFLIHSKRL